MSTGVHRLITGLPGHGKTLYTVSEILRPLVDTTIDHNGAQVPRRLCVSGIRDLALVHQPFDCPDRMEWDKWKDDNAAIKREPGEPVALPDGVAASIVNWWAWVEPGDVIVLDECQRAFRPAASGRAVPRFIAELERARHYGVQFVFITQHPGLLHSNVRNLVGPHQNVARVFGRGATFVYTWDHCSNPDRVKSAQAKLWRHPKDAFKLYKSAEVHTKFAGSLPWQLFVMVGALVAAIALGIWYAQRRGAKPATAGEPTAQSTAVPSAAAAVATTVDGRHVWPVLNVSATKPREPFADRGIHLAGSYEVAGLRRSWYTITVDGRPVATLSDQQMARAGYSVKWIAPCSVVMHFAEMGERPVTCDAPQQANVGQDVRAAQPQQAASAPLV